MTERNCLILTQYREESTYNDFIGKYYHFPATKSKNYLKQFGSFPVEFVYFEPQKGGKGEFFGYGRILKPPFPDKREDGFYFAEIAEFKEFSKPVFFRDSSGVILEERYNSVHYNPQNAVRKIESDLLDGLCLDGGIQLNFEADAHLIEVLGEQLIESEKVGILELIKNSFDAGAGVCKLRIEKVPALPSVKSSEYLFDEYEGPVIVIEDDGVGMSKEVIENGWLRPATTLKTDIKERLLAEKSTAAAEGKLSAYESLVAQLKAAHRGRIPLGEKGVGRFATHRLGRFLVITTKTKDIDYELVLRINWDDFATTHTLGAVDLDSLKVALERQPLSRDYGPNNSGTRLIISGGRENFNWTGKAISDLNESINQLNSPNPNPERIAPSFKVDFICPQIPDLDREPTYKSFKPTFSFYGLVNEKGIAEEITINFDPPRRIGLEAERIELKDYDLKVGNNYWAHGSAPSCGPFYFHFDIWYRDKEWIEEPGSTKLFDYLVRYGGISLYRDNTLVLPAELANKYDVYGLGLRQSQKAQHVSYRYMVANIEIDQLENPLLTDKTSREGLIENKQFLDFVELVKSLINVFETRAYFHFRDRYANLTKGITRDPAKLNDAIKQQRKLLTNIRSYYPVPDDPYTLFEQIADSVESRENRLIDLDSSLKNLRESLELIDEVQDILKEKAAYGISVAISVHEIAKITSNFYSGIIDLLKSDVIDRIKLEDLKSASESLRTELTRLSPLRAIRNEKPVQFKLSRSIKFAYEIFRRKLDELNIEFVYDSTQDIDLFARYGTMNQVLGNLFDNSIHWLQFVKSDSRRIILSVDPIDRTLIFADSGTGISDVIRNNLFEAGYSTRVPPSGLGLYICRHFMQAMKGDIYETHKRDRIDGLGAGAQFTLDFERVPSRQEESK